MRNLFLTILAFILMATGSLSAQVTVTTRHYLEFTPLGVSTTYIVGDNEVEIGKYLISNPSGEDVKIANFRFHNMGDADMLEMFSNVTCHVNNEVISVYVDTTLNSLSFTLNSIIESGDSWIFEIKAQGSNQIGEVTLALRQTSSFLSEESGNFSHASYSVNNEDGYLASYSFEEAAISQLEITRTDEIENGTTVVAGLDDVTVIKFMLDNNDAGAVYTAGITVQAEGTGNASEYQNFTAAFFVNGTQQGSSKNFDSNGIANFNDLSIPITDSGQEEFTLVINTIESSAPGSIQFNIISVNAENIDTEEAVTTFNADSELSENNPLEGAVFELINGATITYEINEFIAGDYILENTQGNDILNIRFYATGDDAAIKDFYFENLLDAEVETMGSWALIENNNLIQTKMMVGDIIHFELPGSDRINIPKDGFVDIWIQFNCFEIDENLSGKQFQLDLMELEIITMATGGDLPLENISGTALSEVFTITNDPEMVMLQGDLFNQKIKIFPNPTSDILNISSDEEIKRITIKNSNGQVILSQEYSQKIDVSAFFKGMYIIQLHTKSGNIVSEKFMKH